MLLIDDDLEAFVLFQDLFDKLEDRRYTVDWAHEYSAGLSLLEANRHDLCLLDYRLGDRIGLDLLTDAQAAGCQVPIVVVTARGTNDVEREALRRGAIDYLVKDRVDVESLWRVTREALVRNRELEGKRRSEDYLQAIFAAASDGMLVTDDEGRCIDANPAALRMLGVAREKLLGKRLGELAGATFRPEHGQAFLEKGASEGEWELRRSGGGSLIIESHSTSQIVPGRHLSVLRDVTEVKKLRALLEVAGRMASLGTLAAGMAHEINNPLTVVLANAHLAARTVTAVAAGHASSLEQAVEALRDLVDASDRIRLIVRDLRVFSRVDELDKAPVDVRRPIEAALRMAWAEIRHRAQVVKHFEDVPSVDANEARLGQVFTNLLINAAQAMPEGEASRHHIRIGVAVHDGNVVVRIDDTGAGIPPEVLPRVFEPFFTTKPFGVGTGLGLSICHGIVTSIGGQLTVTSRVGVGTTVTVTLPPGKLAVVASPPPARVAPSRRGRVLVVDDDQMVLRTMVAALDEDHDVTAMTSGREVLARVAGGERFDVILCDLMMPDLTGMDLHAALASIAPEQAHRIVFVTGGAFTARAQAFLDTVANRTLLKPHSAEHLLAVIDEVLRANAVDRA